MSITHTWSVDKLNTLNDGSGTVTEVWYNVSSLRISTGTSTSTHEFIKLDVNNISNFVPYNSLSESTVIGWVHSILGSTKQDIENINVSNIDAIDKPSAPAVVSSSLPW